MNKKILTLMVGGIMYAGSIMGQNLPAYNAEKYQKKAENQGGNAAFGYFLEDNGFKPFVVEGDTLFYKSLPNTNFYVVAPIDKTGYYVGLEGETRSVAASNAQDKVTGLVKLTRDELKGLDEKDAANNIVEKF